MKPAKNLPRSPLSAAQRTASLLRNNAASRFSTPVNIGPLMVRRWTGQSASH